MAERRVTVVAEVGLHARPAATFVQAAAKSPIEVTVSKANREPVNAKSILAVMSLDARQGEEIVIRAEGEGAEALLEELAAIAAAP